MFNFKLEGLRELNRTIENIGIAANDILDDAAIAGAEVIFESAKSIVRVKTGNLRDSLKINKPRRNSSRLKRRASASVTFNRRKAPYGNKIERKYPYLRRAFDTKRYVAAEAVNKKFLDAIGRVI